MWTAHIIKQGRSSWKFTILLDPESVSHSVMSDSVTPWTITCQAPLSMEFSRQEYWSGLPFPSLGDLPRDRIQVVHIAGRFFTVWATREAQWAYYVNVCYVNGAKGQEWPPAARKPTDFAKKPATWMSNGFSNLTHWTNFYFSQNSSIFSLLHFSQREYKNLIVYTSKRMKVSKGDWEVIKYANVRSGKKCEE